MIGNFSQLKLKNLLSSFLFDPSKEIFFAERTIFFCKERWYIKIMFYCHHSSSSYISSKRNISNLLSTSTSTKKPFSLFMIYCVRSTWHVLVMFYFRQTELFIIKEILIFYLEMIGIIIFSRVLLIGSHKICTSAEIEKKKS